MGKYNAAALLDAFNTSTVSTEDNDLNVNIQAQHDGDTDDAGDVAPAPADDFDEGVDTSAAEVVDVPAPESLAEDTSGTPETAELDTAEAVEATENTSEKISNLEEMTDGLESIALQLAQIEQEGIQVTPFISKSLRTQYEFATRKYPGLRNSQTKGIVSTEDFLADPDAAFTASFESVMDSVKGGVAKIVEFLKNLWERIKAFFGNGGAAAKVMKMKASKLGERKAGKQPDRVAVPSLLRKVTVNAASLRQLTQIVKNVSGERYTTLIASMNASAGKDPVTAIFESNKKIFSGAGNLSNVIGGFQVSLTPDGVKISESTSKDLAERIAPLGESELKALLKENENLADAISSHADGATLRKNVNDTMIKILSENGKEDDASWLKRRNATKKAAAAWGKQQAVEQQIVKKAIAVGNAVNNFVAASLGQAAAEKKS